MVLVVYNVDLLPLARFGILHLRFFYVFVRQRKFLLELFFVDTKKSGIIQDYIINTRTEYRDSDITICISLGRQ